MRFGVIREFVSAMKKFVCCEMTTYNILCKGRRIYTSLTEEEYMNIMQDLAIEYYEKGSPNPVELETEMIEEI